MAVFSGSVTLEAAETLAGRALLGLGYTTIHMFRPDEAVAYALG